ncbi:MAG TPA: SafA/ExsA family spore coat assembly protein [Bacillota bacterium]|nr:SafA/ExsA family spore coat assembly protein [Bacillota bacterium]
MKIHIVKKGDTLWTIAEKYEVDFEELKQMNAHLAHPDMIMPGMKIRIPVHKKESKKETKKEHVKIPKEQPIASKKEEKQPQQTKPIENVKEDDHKDHIHIQPVIPFEQQKTPSLTKNTMPKMPSMPELPHMSPIKEEEVKEKQEIKEKPKEPVKEKPVKKEKEKKQEEIESFPLTSHGCHCYCGTCTPMHFAGAQTNPQQQHMQMMYPSHGCGCQQLGMYGNYMYHPMVQGTYMQHMYPAHHQMNGGFHAHPHMMQEGMYHQAGQPFHESTDHMNGSSFNQQWPQQRNYSNGENWQREGEQTGGTPEHISDEESIGNTYPPMYSEESTFYSYPDPPEITEE